MRKPSLLVIFLTVFIDLIGFGIVLPLLPIYSRDFGASGWMIGLIMASYSAMQFIFAPIWGRLSDRVGRRPIILLSLGGGVLSYIVFALGSAQTGTTAIVLLLVSRMAAGVCGANITVAQAYIADITPPDKRSKGMGMIGMAFGLGFIFGPALGSFSFKYLGVTGPGWVAAGFCLTSFVLALFVLPESRKSQSSPSVGRPRFQQWKHTLSRPHIGLLIGIFFLATFGFTCFETTLGLLLGDNFQLDRSRSNDAATIGYLFAYCGFIGAMIQGGAIGRLVKMFGEPKLIAASLLLFGLSMVWLPFIKGSGFGTWSALLGALAMLAAGSSLTRPPVFGLISRLTEADEQGATLGVAQGLGSLARIIGPIFAGSAYEVGPAVPYVVCAGIAMITGVAAWASLVRHERELAQEAPPAAVPERGS